ncbi:anti-sigma factor [Aquabacterium sp.]|uniref:anti-sigma factor n=1 Tax=Aquabacterium sp. TaxID=1872578 RepID=UPI002B6B77F1|nr:anti-sigma factor [Aquabacterium sp.]HSW05211.1 anti-sigma factor [Aquabacterium sp.]
MNLLKPELLEALARDYALGTMSGGARRRFERLQREHFAAQQAVAAWAGRLAHLAKPVPRLPPRPAVWEGLQQRLFPEAVPKPKAPPWWQKVFGGGQVWAGALAGALLCVVVLRQQPDWVGLETHSEALPPSYVGLLLDSAGKPAVLASSRRHGKQITIKLLQPLAVPVGRVAQLWGLPKDGGAPFPLGQVPPSDRPGVSVTLALPDSAEKLFFGTSRLAVSLEVAPAKPGDKPSGDFLLSGHCVKLW